MCIRDRAILELKRVVKEKGREDRIEVMEIPTKYPAGGEKVLIKATTCLLYTSRCV